MRMPAYLMPQTAAVRPSQHEGRGGTTYGDTITTRCRIEAKRSHVQDANGNAVVSNARGFFPADMNGKIKPTDQVECDGITYRVLTAAPQYGRRAISHIEVMLQ